MHKGSVKLFSFKCGYIDFKYKKNLEKIFRTFNF